MLLYKQNSFYNSSPQNQIENANTINDLLDAFRNLVKLKCVSKYIPDILGRLRFLIRNSQNTNSFDKIIEFYNTIWFDNEYFTENTNDAIEAIIRIEKTLLDPDLFLLIGKNENSFFGINAPSESIIPILENENGLVYKNSILIAYSKLLFAICDTYGYPYDPASLSEVFRNLSFSDLVKFSKNDKTSDKSLIHIEVLKGFLNDHNEIFLNNSENSVEIADETKEAFFKGMLILYDIWNHPFTIGKQILIELQKYSMQCKVEDDIWKYFNILKEKNPEHSEMLEDINLLYKNFYMLFTKNFHPQYSPFKDEYIYNYNIISRKIRDLILAYIYQNKDTIDINFFIEIIPNIIDVIITNIPYLKNEQRNAIHSIVKEQLRSIQKEHNFSDYSENSIDILLGIFDDDIIDNAYEASVIKDDGESKIKNANMPKDNRPRAKNGQYTKRTSDIKSVGLTIGHAFNIFNQQKNQIEKQIDNGYNALKDVLFGAKEVRTAVVEGKKFSITSLIKKLLGFMCLFSFGKIKMILFLIIRAVARGKIRKAERRRIIQDIEEELLLIDEKINDASSDGDRKAKYALMRSKSQLQHALERIKYGMEGADDSKAIQVMRANNERMEF